MGYILPVDMYTRENYHKRVIHDEDTPFYIEKPYRVKRIRNQKRRINDEQRRKKYLLTRIKERHKGPKRRQVLEVESTVTGKGKQINERI